jgi:hypothetical protein
MRRNALDLQLAIFAVTLFGCSGETIEPPPPDPRPTQAVAVSGNQQNGTVGQQLAAPLVVQINDQSGNPMSGVAVSFEVTLGGGTLSNASGTTSASGQATTDWTLGTVAGSRHQVTAAVPGTNVSVIFGATAGAGAPAAVSPDSGDNQFAYLGTRLPNYLVVLIRDQYANGVPGQLVQFSTEPGNGTPDSTVAFTDATGRARTRWLLGTVVGEQTAQAIVQGVTGSPVAFTATAHNLSISSVNPAPMVLGQTATIIGTGFDPTPAGNTVTIGSTAVTVTTATDTQLDIAVPSACIPAGPIEVRVSVGAFTSAPDTSDIMPTSFLALAVGEQVIVQDPNDFCLQFAEASGSESYLVGVQSASEVVTSLTPITLTGVTPLGSPGAGAEPTPSFSATAAGKLPRNMLNGLHTRRLLRHRAAEAQIREMDRANFETLRYASSGPMKTEAAIDSNVVVGDTIPIRVITASSCGQFAEITTVVRAKGVRGIYLEDTANPTPGYTAANFSALSGQVDDFIYDTDVGYFGTTVDADNNGRIVVVVTKEVNKRGSLGFTSSCDYFPRSDNNQASNEGEFFYQEAPDPDGDHGEAFSVSEAFATAPTILAHELVHVIQFSQRLSANTFPSIWIVEGQATFGEEVVGHVEEQRQTGQNYGLGVAVNLDDSTSIDWYSDRVADLGFYFGWDPITNDDVNDRIAEAPHECTWLALPPANPGPCMGGRDAYGVPWSLLRWLSDRFGSSYPGGEQGLQQDIARTDMAGYDLIEALIGTVSPGSTIETLLAQWAAMLYLDGRPGFGGHAIFDMTSWDLNDIFYGSYTDGQTQWTLIPALRLTPAGFAFAGFSRSANVRAGSTYYSVITGTDHPALAVSAKDATGGVLPGHMQLWVVRMQ